MNPELSRRVAKIIDIIVALGMNIEGRISFAHRIDSASDFSNLSDKDKKLIINAEKIKEHNNTSMTDIFILNKSGYFDEYIKNK